MRKSLIRGIVAAAALAFAALAGPVRAQSFPFEDAFSGYEPGSTGAPAWSILGGRFLVTDGVLQGPVTIRFNARPPQRFVIDLTLDLPEGDATGAEADVFFDAQHQTDTNSSDMVGLALEPKEGGGRTPALVTAAVSPTGLLMHREATPVAVSSRQGIPVRIAVDTETGRYAVFVGSKAILTAPFAEYPAGLLAIRLSDGAGLDRVLLRAPTSEEKDALRTTTLFLDPRDLADGENGNILLLHRGSPAVLTVTPDGEVTRTFGRRMPGGIPDPVALARGAQGGVLVLDRDPAEVVAFERNGGIRYRFGADHLQEPTDIATLPDGTVYVADPAAHRVVVFSGAGRFLGEIRRFTIEEGAAAGVPTRLGVDPLGNVVVMMEGPASTVTLRPSPDRLTADVVRVQDSAPSDVVALEGKLWALQDGAISAWPRTAGATVFRASAVGGLGGYGRLALVGEQVYALDREHNRIVAVPSTLADVTPSVSFQNIAQSQALVRWASAEPARIARARLLRGQTWDPQTVQHDPPSTEHQVPFERLLPDTTYRYQVQPTLRTIPASGWSVDYSFQTAPATPEPAGTKPPAAPSSPTEAR